MSISVLSKLAKYVNQLINDAGIRANLADSTKGSSIVSWIRSNLATAIEDTVGKKLSQAQVDIWDFSKLVTIRPDPNLPSTWNWTQAIEAARVVLGSMGGGEITFGTGGIYQASSIRLDRFMVLNGRGVNTTELKQIAGTNSDFIKSENFDALTGSGLTVVDPRVPSWMGLKDIRVNGNRYEATLNPSGNTSGIVLKMYGPAQLLYGNVMIFGGASGGIYTEDAAAASGIGWQAQEEGRFDDVLVMDNGGFAGWHCRGPHNSTAKSITCGRNDGWNFYSEESTLFGGGFDNIGSLHTYAGGRATSPASDTGAYLGGIARIGTLVSDGDNVSFVADNIQISKWRAFNLGGVTESIISGNDCQIDNLNGSVWSGSTGKTALTITGNNARVAGTLTTNNANNNGVWIKGTGHKVDMTIRNFSGAGYTGLKLESTDTEVKGKIRNCNTAFNYVSGTDNQVNLNIATSAGQVAVAGLAPRLGDRFDIRSRGDTVGGCKTNLRSSQVAMDITTYTVVPIAHGLLYTPPIEAVRANWLASSPDSSVWDESILRVVTTTATEVVIGYKMAVAAPAGTLARIGVTIDLT
ncbi:hypothetical protein D3C75_441190 [compost metagenome]